MRFWSVEQFLFNEHSGTFWNMWPRNKKRDFYMWPYVYYLVLWILIVLRAEIQILKSFINRISSSLKAKGNSSGTLGTWNSSTRKFSAPDSWDQRWANASVQSLLEAGVRFRGPGNAGARIRFRSVTKSHVRKSKSCSSLSISDQNGFYKVFISDRFIKTR